MKNKRGYRRRPRSLKVNLKVTSDRVVPLDENGGQADIAEKRIRHEQEQAVRRTINSCRWVLHDHVGSRADGLTNLEVVLWFLIEENVNEKVTETRLHYRALNAARHCLQNTASFTTSETETIHKFLFSASGWELIQECLASTVTVPDGYYDKLLNESTLNDEYDACCVLLYRPHELTLEQFYGFLDRWEPAPHFSMTFTIPDTADLVRIVDIIAGKQYLKTMVQRVRQGLSTPVGHPGREGDLGVLDFLGGLVQQAVTVVRASLNVTDDVPDEWVCSVAFNNPGLVEELLFVHKQAILARGRT